MEESNIDVKEKKKIFTKNILIILLLIIILVLTIFVIFSKINYDRKPQNSTFMEDILKYQNKISYYTGLTYSDTFGMYNNTEILSSFDDENGKRTKITNSKNNEIVPLIDIDKKIEKNRKVYYEIINENVLKVLNQDMTKYADIKWYIQDGELLKVSFDKAPEWWTSDFDIYKVGSN